MSKRKESSQEPMKKTRVLYDDKTQAITIKSADFSTTFHPDGTQVAQIATDTGVTVKIKPGKRHRKFRITG